MLRERGFAIGALACLATTAVRLAAQTPALPSSVTPGPIVEGVYEYRWPNGLKALLVPDASRPTVTTNVVVRVGSLHEGYGETGMAHLLEHMLFKGSPRHPDFDAEATAHGVIYNASTANDRTAYFLRLASKPGNLAWALDLEADRLVHASFTAAQLRQEFTVVRNEMEMGENSPSGILEERVIATAFLWHGYGRSTIGARSDVEGVPWNRLRGFYRRFYQPDNATVIVAGGFAPLEALRLIDRTFGRIPRPSRTGSMTLYPTYTRDPVQDGERTVTLRRAGDLQVVTVAYHVPAAAHPDFPAIEVLADLLGSSTRGTLQRALVRTGIAATIDVSAEPLKEPYLMLASASVRGDRSLDSAKSTLLQTLAQAASAPPSLDEVTRAKAALLARIELDLTEAEGTSFDLAEWDARSDWRLLFLHRDRLRRVTPEDVHRVAAAYLKPDNRTVGTFLPTGTPDRAVIAEAPPADSQVRGYRGASVAAVTQRFSPKLADIQARLRTGTLPNGMSVTLLPAAQRGEAVFGGLVLRYGSLATLEGAQAALDAIPAMLTRGTAVLSREQIADSLVALRADVDVSGEPGVVRVSFQTTKPYLVDLLKLMTQLLTSSTIPDSAFAEYKQERLAQLERWRSDPFRLSINVARGLLEPLPAGHPLATLPLDVQRDEVTRLKAEQVRDIYRRLLGASQAQLVVVGSVEDSTVRLAAGQGLGRWKSPAAPAPLLHPPVVALPIDTVLPTPDKANASVVVGQRLALSMRSRDYPALLLADYMLGGYMGARYFSRIREKEGLSYDVRTWLEVHARDTLAFFTATAITAPQNAARVVDLFREVTADVRAHGFTPEEVERAREGLLALLEQQVGDPAALVYRLGEWYLDDRTLADEGRLNAAIQRLTPVELQDVVRHYLDSAKWVVVRAGDLPALTPAASR